ncbi:unnamed protein product [Thlaspi arvense]|uniref:Uncharacterized protein n=1 Tax=Thlaspi arvense TaxID=13288 RepID=A0AAU9R8X4_THLAR|nr:unnamed protein product [Thlaspi arvense]
MQYELRKLERRAWDGRSNTQTWEARSGARRRANSSDPPPPPSGSCRHEKSPSPCNRSKSHRSGRLLRFTGTHQDNQW